MHCGRLVNLRRCQKLDSDGKVFFKSNTTACKDITVLGRTGLSALYVAAHSLKLGKYASEHDIKIAQKVAYVLCGGDLTSQQKVSEQYLLDIEREAMMSLCGEPKTLERIQYMLTNNKPLRN